MSPVHQISKIADISLKVKTLSIILNKYSPMFRRKTERHCNIQTMITNTLEYLNIYFKITSIFPEERKSDIVTENENKMYIIDITVAFDCQEDLYNANSRKIEKYCDLVFIIPFFIDQM